MQVLASSPETSLLGSPFPLMQGFHFIGPLGFCSSYSLISAVLAAICLVLDMFKYAAWFGTVTNLFQNWPVLPSPAMVNISACRSSGSARVNNLLHMAGNLGKAVGTLVTVMTDDEEASGSDDDLKQ